MKMLVEAAIGGTMPMNLKINIAKSLVTNKKCTIIGGSNLKPPSDREYDIPSNTEVFIITDFHLSEANMNALYDWVRIAGRTFDIYIVCFKEVDMRDLKNHANYIITADCTSRTNTAN